MIFTRDSQRRQNDRPRFGELSTTAVPQPRPDWQNDWQQLLSYLPQDYEQLAREHKMLEVQYGNAKIKTAQDLLRFVFVHVGCDLPLRQSVAVVGAGLLAAPELGPMAIDCPHPSSTYRRLAVSRTDPHTRAVGRSGRSPREQ